jgi:hypothetical protein
MPMHNALAVLISPPLSSLRTAPFDDLRLNPWSSPERRLTCRVFADPS